MTFVPGRPSADPEPGDAPDAGIAARLKAWAIDAALPLWADRGLDRVRGGFHEQLRADGAPELSVGRRLRVQARQIYVYANAAVLGWYPEGAALALDATDAMVRRYRSPDGHPGYVHLLAADGSVASDLRDTYDHAFVLLALSWTARASGDAQMRALIDEVLGFLDEHLAARDGSFQEGVPSSLPRRQNPHMHLFEAMLALHETLGHPEALPRAARLKALFEQRLFDPQTQTIGEYFTDDWRLVTGREGESVEPGHQAEWTWLLRRHERLAGLAPGTLASELLDSALRGEDQATGFLIDEMDRTGAVLRDSRRTWPQTELAKAWIAEAENGRPGAAVKAELALTRLADAYLDVPFAGGWTDQFDAAGEPLTQHVPASTFYHIFCAIAEADRVLGAAPPPR